MAASTVHKIMKKAKYHPYKVPLAFAPEQSLAHRRARFYCFLSAIISIRFYYASEARSLIKITHPKASSAN
ncbi:hypothetical protein NQ318_003200 [Aromia moschata]|uniref:Uncharacterized protein n=1 Tax=Aromia moschata TaxID=1265417 RepID=A0AAV8YI42_9CUCU|nr:hypothetical protein NQ318_003200 [Aromia moschata]